METAKSIPLAVAPANVADPAAETLPWMPERARARATSARSDRPGEAVHWSVVALTVITALSVLIGAYGLGAAPPRELLPIVIDAR
jgi:hypothetical protein